MREIEFRGKDKQTGEWRYGYYTTAKSRDPETGEIIEIHIIHSKNVMYEVDPNTIGQFTGVSDKNNKRIYEGDIVRFVKGLKKDLHGDWIDNTEEYTVKFKDGAFNVASISKCRRLVEVVGNMYDEKGDEK